MKQTMKKRSLFTFFLMIIMIFSLSSMVSAAWKTDEEGNTYYMKKGVALTLGPHTISGKKYLFTSDGILIKNDVTIRGGRTYVSKADGSLITDFAKYKGNYYYGTKDGYCKRGFQTYNKSYYYFQKKTGAAVKNGWVTIKDNQYYFRANGRAVRSTSYVIDGDKYFFNEKGQVRKGGLTRIGDYYYLLGRKTGKMQVGSVKYGSYWYFCNTSKGEKRGRVLTDAWKKLDGNEYYYNSLGRRQTGWLILGSRRYYLDPAKKGAKTYGKKKIDGKTYDFGTNGYVAYKLSGQKLVLKVNRKTCVVTAYDQGMPVKAMTCSSGGSSSKTPVGTFFITDHLSWWMLNGPSYGQYCSHFLPDYLFHSVPVYGTSRNPYGVSASDYNRLGTPASGGCVRLSVADAKWIYYNAPIGSTVIISDSEAAPLGKPTPKKMKAGTKGADPTDDFHNPGGYDVRLR